MNSAVGRVVVVEDEAAIREAVLTGLRQGGFTAMGFADAVDPELILVGAPDLAVLDIALPGGSGFALARALRARSAVSIIFLTARDAVADRVQGLELGADDYVVKPVRPGGAAGPCPRRPAALRSAVGGAGGG
ncbi:MAG: response regulator transcription factor [Solirubrobacteraceae bacterium]